MNREKISQYSWRKNGIFISAAILLASYLAHFKVTVFHRAGGSVVFVNKSDFFWRPVINKYRGFCLYRAVIEDKNMIDI